MASTVYAQRCAELKDRYTKSAKCKEPSFITQYNALWALANLGRLSRHNVIWLGKQIIQMIEQWTEPDQREMLDRLQARQARAWDRWRKRIAEREAAKIAGTGKRGRKQPTAKPTPDPPAPNLDPWEDS